MRYHMLGVAFWWAKWTTGSRSGCISRVDQVESCAYNKVVQVESHVYNKVVQV